MANFYEWPHSFSLRHAPDLNLGDALLIQQHQLARDVIEWYIREEEVLLLQLAEAGEARRTDEDEMVQAGAQAHHLTFDRNVCGCKRKKMTVRTVDVCQ